MESFSVVVFAAFSGGRASLASLAESGSSNTSSTVVIKDGERERGPAAHCSIKVSLLNVPDAGADGSNMEGATGNCPARSGPTGLVGTVAGVSTIRLAVAVGVAAGGDGEDGDDAHANADDDDDSGNVGACGRMTSKQARTGSINICLRRHTSHSAMRRN